jgi:hypothetical protein
MQATDLAIQYSGFEPAEDVQARLYCTLNDLLDESPSGAFIKATFTKPDKKESMIKGVLQVNCCSGPFLATEVGNDVVELLQSLNATIRIKLDKWKNKRFLRPVGNFPSDSIYI